jgi:tRNA-dihydrouridine synthase B
MLRIGSLVLDNWLLLAPMAGITTRAFRLTVKRLAPGPGLVTTEMVSAAGLVRGGPRTWSYLASHPDEGPLGVQLFGSDPDLLAEAAHLAAGAGARLVDLNMGCPVRKVIRTGAGAALLQDRPRIRAILAAVRKRCPVPLTVKIRPGWSPAEADWPALVGLLEDSGADAVTVHARYAVQGFAGMADWDLIAAAKERVRIPIIGNGDVREAGDALAMRARTGCDGVMIGRSSLKNPWIFSQISDLATGDPARLPTLAQRRTLIETHFELLCEEQGARGAALAMRGLLLRYSKGLPQSTAFRGALTTIRDLPSLRRALDTYFEALKGWAP